jgi:hypothetical protein
MLNTHTSTADLICVRAERIHIEVVRTKAL